MTTQLQLINIITIIIIIIITIIIEYRQGPLNLQHGVVLLIDTFQIKSLTSFLAKPR